MVKTIGVLALQGGFKEHIHHVKQCGAKAREVRLPKHLEGLDGLIIPGGESTTIIPLLHRWQLFEAIQQQVDKEGLHLWGTCAGAIVLAKNVLHLSPRYQPLGGIDLTIDRNAYGAQSASFESTIALEKKELGKSHSEALFIRAPQIVAMGDKVTVLARLPDGEKVAVKQGRYLATTFHPELTEDSCFHAYFIQQCGDG
ncbi:MAG: pyridoxal 5'-phosphate synthase glutaminase subunit PdxT [Gammaproteobacteria bacterium]